MIFQLQEQHYVLSPTRQASRWKQERAEVVLETDDLATAALYRVGTLPDPPNRDIFLRVKGGVVTKDILDEYWKYRRMYVAAG